MFNSPILDVSITLVFTYFILAIIVSAFNEFITALLSLRANMLQAAINNFIPDAQWQKICDKVMNSGFITSLQTDPKKFPSYIPSKNFALAVISSVGSGKTDLSNTEMIRSFITENIPDESETRKMFISLLNKSENDIQKVQDNLENLFNESMDRLSGVYKRKIQKIVFMISFIITLLLNVDTINITNHLWNNPTLAKAAAEQIHVLAVQDSLAHIANKINSSQSDSLSKDSQTQIKNIQHKIDFMKEAHSVIKEMPLPIGWVSGNYPKLVNQSFDLIGWISKLIGILITAFAITVGAPFWFDLLNKLVNMRSAGKKPESTTSGSTK